MEQTMSHEMKLPTESSEPNIWLRSHPKDSSVDMQSLVWCYVDCVSSRNTTKYDFLIVVRHEESSCEYEYPPYV